MARPSAYSPEVAEEICRRMASGESLRAICASEDMPADSTVRLWAVTDREGFSAQYARAREFQADALFDECLEIADETSGDFIEKQLGDEGPTVEIVDHEHIARSRLRVDIRKWAAGRLAPKKYGDRVLNEHSGPEGKPIAVQNASLSPEQVRDELANIFGANAIAAVAAALPSAAPERAQEGDRVVHADADDGGGPLPGAPAPGEAMAKPE